MACLEALHFCTSITQIERSFKCTGLFPRDPEMALMNPRINKDVSVLITDKKRKRISIDGKIITSEVLIQELEEQKEQNTSSPENSKSMIFEISKILITFYLSLGEEKRTKAYQR